MQKQQGYQRVHIFDVIDSERKYQDQKWGTIQEHPHEVGGWLTILRVHLAKAEAEWASSRGDQNALDELRKLLAVGMACAEQHGLPERVTKTSAPEVTIVEEQVADAEIDWGEKVKSILKENGYQFCKSCGRELDQGDLAWNEASTEAGTPHAVVVCQCQNCLAGVFEVRSWWPSMETLKDVCHVLDGNL